MAFISEEMDNDLLRLWGLVAELSEQLNANRALTAVLQSQAGQVKGQAIHTGTGYVLRRFNTDLSKEVFESEIERMNAGLIIENQSLLHENKQLSSLLKEYEQTLETVMAKFRSQAHTAQQHELLLTRHYETLLLGRESNTLNQDLSLSSSSTESLARISHLLRKALRAMAGEEPESEDALVRPPDFADIIGGESENPEDSAQLPRERGEREQERERGPEYREGGYAGSSNALDDWALEREIEITRLEKENEELRKLLGIGESVALSEPQEWEKLPPGRLFPSGPTRRGILAHGRASRGGPLGPRRGGGPFPQQLTQERRSGASFKEFPS